MGYDKEMATLLDDIKVAQEKASRMATEEIKRLLLDHGVNYDEDNIRISGTYQVNFDLNDTDEERSVEMLGGKYLDIICVGYNLDTDSVSVIGGITGDREWTDEEDFDFEDLDYLTQSRIVRLIKVKFDD